MAGPTRRPAHWRHWTLPLALAGAAILLQLGGPEVFRWERGLTAAEPWRLLTGQLVHLGWVHLVLNLAGLTLVWLVLGPGLGTRGGLAATFASGTAVCLGLALASPGVGWYVGLSGTLHGLLAAGALAELRQRRWFAMAVLGGLGVKLAAEWLAPAGGTAALIGGAVITEAHLYGALGGTAYGLWRAFRIESRP